MQGPYQYDYAALHPSVLDPVSRQRKARTAIRVLKAHLGDDLKNKKVLDIGGSGGAMAFYLAEHTHSVISVDIDRPALESARKLYRRDNLEFSLGDAMALEFEDQHFDIVLCCHVYEHVPDSNRLLKEIHRVLRPQGVCYFAAGNRLAWREPHYGLPLLSVLPRPLAHLYLRLMRRGYHYHERHLSYWGLRQLVRKFLMQDYTFDLIDRPTTFATEYLIPPGTAKQRLAKFIAKRVPWLCPSYIWILERTNSTGHSITSGVGK